MVDIFDLDTGTFYTYEQYDELYPGSVDFLTYHTIISCILRIWKQILKISAPSQDADETWLQKFQRICQIKKPAAALYNFFRDETSLDNSTLLILWNNDLRQKIELKAFQKLFISLRKLTLSTKLRYFQYRILVRALTLNIHVNKWDKNVSMMCSFCNQSPETTLHFFTECSVSKKMWKALSKWLKHWYNIDTQFSPPMIILGNYKGRDRDLVNMFILIAKFHLYRCRVQKIPVKFTSLITDVTRVKDIERVIANKQGKRVLFDIRWQV